MISQNDNSTNPILITTCGLNCHLCRAYGRDKNPCPGCRLEGSYKSKMCVECKINNCEKLVNGEFEYCYECEEFPCKRITHLDKSYKTKYETSVIDNLLRIKEIGVTNFIENDILKWTCPECGVILSMHKTQCLACGYVWHK